MMIDQEFSDRVTKRARKLLKDHLTPEQWREWERKREFKVVARGRQYTVRGLWANNIQGPMGAQYCITSQGQGGWQSPNKWPRTPIEDHVLGLKLLIQYNPAAMRNRSG